jgi:hypothetical protein
MRSGWNEKRSLSWQGPATLCFVKDISARRLIEENTGGGEPTRRAMMLTAASASRR